MRNVDSSFLFDPIAFRDELNSSWQLLQQESGTLRWAIRSRYEDTVQRIGATAHIHSLQRLDGFQKFLRSVEVNMDRRDALIVRMVTGFNAIDNSYWDGVIRSRELIAENSSLKAQIEILCLRIQILEGGLKRALQKSRRAMDQEQANLQMNENKVA